MKIDFNALADFAIMNFDCSEVFEDDCWCFEFEGQRIYCERHAEHFKIEIGSETFELPRL